MSGRWGILALVLALATTLLNAAVFVGQLSTPASARSSETNASKLLSDEDFVDANVVGAAGSRSIPASASARPRRRIWSWCDACAN